MATSSYYAQQQVAAGQAGNAALAAQAADRAAKEAAAQKAAAQQQWLATQTQIQRTPTVSSNAPVSNIAAPALAPAPTQTTSDTVDSSPKAFSFGAVKDAAYAADPLNAHAAWKKQHPDEVAAATEAKKAADAKAASDAAASAAKTPAVTTAQAANWNVTPEQTVQSQLSGLLDDNNQLTQMAKAKALQDAQSRGLLNGSMGAEAGALAAYQYAMPIATSDATTYASAAKSNADNQTAINQFNAGSYNNRANAELSADTSIKTAGIAAAASRANAKTSAQASMYNTNANNQAAMERQVASDKAATERAVQLQNLQESGAMSRLDYSTKADMAKLQENLSFSQWNNYFSATSSLNDNYMSAVSNINASTIPTEAKASQLSDLNTAFGTAVSLNNAIAGSSYKNAQDWLAIPKF